ncbi:Na/Pi cotransporter family protein [Ideonella sp. BN130291]|uniref:Na/Pi cotransporter family protein n=1 Tax=Ideonella sp. BN130291 TaxID=3112940 RepID=UPI002E25E379|nr:Na/Pi cotransporter family protein [Ideonella sp. BN130291]
MQHLLNLLAAISLLVWGTHIVRTGMLRLMGGSLRRVLAQSTTNRLAAATAGIGVTALVQSSTATSLIVTSFVAQKLMPLAAALAVMLGADVGTSLMVAVFSLDLSWLSPLLIFVGVVLFIPRQSSNVGQAGRVLIGLGLITLALQLIVGATQPLMRAEGVRVMLGSLNSDALLDILAGSMLAVLSYSSLATVLLTATLAESGVVPIQVALGLVLGANLGSGVMGVLTTARSTPEARRLPLGNLLFKTIGCLVMAPFLNFLLAEARPLLLTPASTVVLFHLAFNILLSIAFLPFTAPIARLLQRVLPSPEQRSISDRPRHLDPVALATPSLAISCAAREALHQADVVETMLAGMLTVIRNNDLQLAEKLRTMDDTVDELYSAIKYYLTKISREALDERESRRWTDIISFTINMEQIGDIVERVITDIEDRKIKPGREFSEAGMTEIAEMHARLLDNLRLSMGVFLHGNVRDAKKLLEEKARFRDLQHKYASTHLERLHEKTASSMETSSLHIDLISDLKRINSHICSIAYPILESAGVLADTRIRHSRLMDDAA